MQHGDLPTGLVLQRTTDEFSAERVPAGFLRAHRLAPGVWGMLRVTGGSLAFVWEDHPDDPVALVEGDAVVIPPEVPHRVEPRAGVRFVVEFHR